MNSSMNQDQKQRCSEPLVSVLVPSYNHEKYVIDCLESIKGSSHKRLELVLSDDRSPDRTYELADAWARQNAERFERVVVVRQDVNLGIVKNFQFLFDNAHGEYLACLASDDMLTASGITDRLEVLEKEDAIDAVFGHSQPISESGGFLREHFLPPHAAKAYASKKLLPYALLRYWGPGGPVMMLRRSAVLEGGSLGRFPDDLQFEDRYLYIRLAAQGKLRFVERVVAKYRVLDNSMSRAPAFLRVALQGNASSDQKNLHLFAGWDRLYLAMQIARSNLDLNKDAGSMYLLKRMALRIASGLLSRALFLRARLA